MLWLLILARFPTGEQALAQWRSHEGEFRQLAAEWRQSGGEEFYPCPDSWWVRL